MIYWDNNATTAMAPEVEEAMRPFYRESFYNPSAAYSAAKKVRHAVDEAREKVAALLGATPDEIIFTSGGTESTNTALRPFSRVLSPAIEHPATLRSIKGRETLCPVRCSGEIDTRAWKQLLPGHDCATFAWANHETGVVQPVGDLCEAAEHAGVFVHVDAVQAAGKLHIALHDFPINYASVSAHKLHGPQGVGALYVKRGSALSPLLLGGGQEDGRRAGTENVPGIVGFGVAAELALQAVVADRMHARLRDRFLGTLRAAGVEVLENGGEAERLSHVLNMRIPGCSAESLTLLLEPMGFLCASGSACTSAEPHASHVLLAMGLSDREARESLRLSWNRYTDENEVDAAAQIFINCVRKLQAVRTSEVQNVVVYTPEQTNSWEVGKAPEKMRYKKT